MPNKINKMKILNFLFFIALTTCYGSYAQETNSTKTIIKNNTYLKGDVVKIPLAIILDWPFIDGAINGAKGRCMFDTGNGGSIRLHSKKVLEIESKTIGKGFVSSGQKYEVL